VLSVQLHAGSSQNGTYGSSCATLFPNDFTNVTGRYREAIVYSILLLDWINSHCFRMIYQAASHV
jgi:hypothetical protein